MQLPLNAALDFTSRALNMAQVRSCILVCGVHRSGTSALTRVINLLGADIALDLIPAHADNIRGYWESAAVIEIHQDLLKSLESFSEDPLDPLPFPVGWEELPAAQRAKLRLKNLIAPRSKSPQ